MTNDKYLIKFEENSNSKFGCNPYKRDFNVLLDYGFILIDKDAGPTSHQSADFLKKVLGIKKAGHSGTLDPKVTGVLVCGLGHATRLMEYMLKSNKEYVCLMYVHKEVTKEQILDVFEKFTGKIMQTPPIVSAVKRQEREREIYYIELLDFENGQNVLFRVGCQHGTYIRKLCSDMGDVLGTKAHMKELRRTKAGPFREDDFSIGLDKLRNLFNLYQNCEDEKEKEIYEKELRQYIRPMEELLRGFKRVYVRDSAVDSLCHGSDLAIPGVAKLDKNIEMGEEIGLFTLKDELIGIGISYLSAKDVIKKKKGAFVKTHKVFMQTDIYPRKWDFEEMKKRKLEK